MDFRIEENDIPAKLNIQQLRQEIIAATGLPEDQVHVSSQGAGKNITQTFTRVAEQLKDKEGRDVVDDDGKPVMSHRIVEERTEVDVRPTIFVHLPDDFKRLAKVTEAVKAHKPAMDDAEEVEQNKLVKMEETLKKTDLGKQLMGLLDKKQP